MVLRRLETKEPGELSRSLSLSIHNPIGIQESTDNLLEIIELYSPDYKLSSRMTAQKLSVRYLPIAQEVNYREALKWCPKDWTPDRDFQIIDGSKRLAIRKFEEVVPDNREVIEIVEAL